MALPFNAKALSNRVFLNKCCTIWRPYVSTSGGSNSIEGGRASNPDGPTFNVPSKEIVTPMPPLSQPIPDLPPVQYARPNDQGVPTQVTRLSNGLRVASQNRFGQFCTVGVVIDSGPRYEMAYPSGVSHFLEKLAFQSTQSFGEKDVIFKELEKHGGICDCQSSRDTFVYAASADSRGLESVSRILADVVLRPKLADDEVDLARQSVKFELETLGMRPEQEPILMDMIHAAAFRDNTLGLPKLCPLENADKIDRTMLLNYLRHHHSLDRMVLAGVGVAHDDLVRMAEKYFVEGSATWEMEKVAAKDPSGVDTSIAQYTGGSKLVECPIPVYAAVGLPELAHVVIGLNGCSHQDKDFIAACVLNIMMGGGGSFSAGGPGKGMYTRLYTNVLNRYHWMYSATAYNHAYGDSGLFCIHATAPPTHIRSLVEVITRAKFQVVVCTCQILLDVLKHGYLSIKHINLLIFDECHHGVGEHPMHGIMEQFLRVPKSDHPRVIGLSGMLLYKQIKTVDQVSPELERLENTFNSTIATVGSYDAFTEVCRFSTNPKELLVSYDSLRLSPVMVDIVRSIEAFSQTINDFHLPKYLNQNKALMKDRPKPLKEIKKLFTELVYQLGDTGLFGCSIALLGLIVQFELDKRQSDSSMLRLALRSCITFCESLRHQIEKLMSGLDIKEKLTRFSSLKIRQLINELEKMYERNRDKKAKTLVFVQRRFSAKVLYHVLKIYFSQTEDADLILPDFMVGSNGSMPESIEQILSAKKDRRVIERFKKNETNVIVTTNVLEEGIDLQMCNTVIKYDHPQTFASYQQSKGRARMKDSQYMVMLNNEERQKFLEKYRLYKSIEQELQRCLIGKTINRPDPLDADVHKELYNEIIPPFFTAKGAKLDALSAVQLLNRYCMGMPRDAFTNTNVTWERVDLKNGQIVVEVMLPLQSTVREKILGNPMRNIKLAKRSAAFNACRKLYENKELSEHLIPIDCRNQLNNLKDVYFRHWADFDEDSGKLAGTQKCIRTHAIEYPKQTTGCFPEPGKPCYIYVLRIGAGFEQDPSNENVNIFHSLYNSENNFGIMTTKPLPVLAKMKFFVTLGLINVHLVETPIVLPNAGSEVELALLRQFHVTVFRDVLRLWKDFLVYDYDNGINSFMVVPLKKSTHLDWELIRQFQYLSEPPSEMSTMARSRMDFEADNYRHKVILPWYKNNKEQPYVVTMVHEHLTPGSPFPNAEYGSYANYFSEAYHLAVVKPDQFLIEVKGITSYLNRLNPGVEDDGKSTRSKHWRFNEILIPELCHNYQFPADYWLKATLLPSALHRIHYLLLAEKIRVDLATGANVGCLENHTIEDVDVEYKQRKGKQSEEELELMEFEDDEDEDDEFDLEEAKRSLMAPQDLNELAKNQMTSVTGDIPLPWQDDEEPVDIERNWDQVSKMDLDYYNAFVNKFSDLSVREMTAERISSAYTSAIYRRATSSPKREPMAILDIPVEQKFAIKLLQLNPANTINVNLQQKDILKAITTKSAADVFDLERYELLGDAFLKFATSLYLIKYHKEWHEGFLTAVKGQIVSNRNLVYCAIKYGLPGMLKVHKFDPKNDWQPPLATVPKNIKQTMQAVNHSARVLYRLTMTDEEIKTGVVDPKTSDEFIAQLEMHGNTPDPSPMANYLSQQTMGDKTPADAMEALLGVCVQTVGMQRSFKLLPYFGMLPKTHDVLKLLDEKIENQRLRTHIDYREVDGFLKNHSRIESILGYKFKDRTYLLQALTHASYPTNRITGSYQQLEFLGDAVLDFLISMYIFEQNPTMSPGQLTDLRSALVNNITLACLLVRHGLHLYILAESASFSDTVNKFVMFQEQNKHEITDQVNLLVEESDRKMAEFVDVPKALGDVFESLVAAVFLDSGNDFAVTWRVIYGMMGNEIMTFTENTPIQIVRQLYEFKPPCSPIFSRAIPDDDTVLVKLKYKIRNQQHEAYGFGQNKDDAKRAAAKAALQVLRKHYRSAK